MQDRRGFGHGDDERVTLDSYVVATPTVGGDGDIYIAATDNDDWYDAEEDHWVGYWADDTSAHRLQELTDARLAGDEAVEDDVLALYGEALEDAGYGVDAVELGVDDIDRNGPPHTVVNLTDRTARGNDGVAVETPFSLGMLLAVMDGAPARAEIDGRQDVTRRHDARTLFRRKMQQQAEADAAYFDWDRLEDHPLHPFVPDDGPRPVPTGERVDTDGYERVDAVDVLTDEVWDDTLDASLDYRVEDKLWHQKLVVMGQYIDRKTDEQIAAAQTVKQYLQQRQEQGQIGLRDIPQFEGFDEETVADAEAFAVETIRDRLEPGTEKVLSHARRLDTGDDTYLLRAIDFREGLYKEWAAASDRRTVRDDVPDTYVRACDAETLLGKVLDRGETGNTLYVDTAPIMPGQALIDEADDHPFTAEVVPNDLHVERDGTWYDLPRGFVLPLLTADTVEAVHIDHAEERPGAIEVPTGEDVQEDEDRRYQY